MRKLKFIVERQLIKPDPNCDFTGLVPGTSGYLQAEFSFSPEWNECAKAVTFYSVLGKEYSSVLLKDGKTCMIPAEALERRSFKLQVTGRCVGKQIMTTNRVTVNQNGGKE